MAFVKLSPRVCFSVSLCPCWGQTEGTCHVDRAHISCIPRAQEQMGRDGWVMCFLHLFLSFGKKPVKSDSWVHNFSSPFSRRYEEMEIDKESGFI